MATARWTDLTIKNLKCPPDKPVQDFADPAGTALYLRVGSVTGSKTWRFMTRINGRQVPIVLGRYPEVSLGDARAAANEAKKLINEGGDPRDKKRQAKEAAAEEARKAGNTVAAIADDYVKKVLTVDKKCSPAYVRDITLKLRNHVCGPGARWDGWPIGKPTEADCNDLLLAVKEQGSVVVRNGKRKRLRGGSVTANQLYVTFRALFKYAVKQRRLRPDNPMREIDRPASAPRPRRRYLREEELRWFLRAAEQLPFPHGPFLTMLLQTGARRGEVLNVRWRDLDLDGNPPSWTQPTNKSDREHILALTPPIVGLLKSLRQQHNSVLPSQYVFCGPSGEKPFWNMSGQKRMINNKIAELRGQPLEPWALHDLRRSAASHMARLGVPSSTISRCLNHAPKDVTSQHYLKYDYWVEKQHAWATWSAYLESLITPPPSDKVVRLRRSA
jgi:integrase